MTSTTPETDFWNRNMLLAYQEAKLSPDPSSQNGAVLLDRFGDVLTKDCNRFPQGAIYSPERWERPIKYSWIEHAERNAIYAAAKWGLAAKQGTLVCPWAACADCARALVQSGVVRLVRTMKGEDSLALTDRWKTSVDLGDAIMIEGGVEIIEHDFTWPGLVEPFTLLRDGEVWSPCSSD